MHNPHRQQRGDFSSAARHRHQRNHNDRQTPHHSAAPRFPIAIGPSSSLPRSDAAVAGGFVPDGGAGGGMGPREDTSVLPLQPGEVRIPKNIVPPPIIMGRWASVTQTGEMFPATFPDDVLPAVPQSPAAAAATAGTAGAVFLVSPGGRGGATRTAGVPSRADSQPWTQPVAVSATDRKANDEDDEDGLRHGEMERRLTDLLLDEPQERDLLVVPATGEAPCSSPSPLTSPTSGLQPQQPCKRISARSSPLPPSSDAGGQSTAAVAAAVITARELIAKEGPLQTTTSSLLLKRISDHRPRFLFPPPPPPSPASSDWTYHTPYWHPEEHAPELLDPQLPSSVLLTSTPLLRRKMMRWFQIVEQWCIERYLNEDGTVGPEVPDHERAIVAPPPRPPLFSEDVAPQLEPLRAATESPLTAPYTFDRWICVAFLWWARISKHFDELRGHSEKYAGFGHVCKSPPSLAWQPSQVLQMIA